MKHFMKHSMHLPLTLVLLASGVGAMAQTPDVPPAQLAAAKKKAKAAADGPPDQYKGAELAAIKMSDKQIRTMQLLLTTFIRGGNKQQLQDKKGKSKDLVKNVAADPDNSMISFAAQGIPLDPTIKKGDEGDFVYVCKLMDRLNPRTGAFGLNKKPLSSIYGDIMDFAIPLPGKAKKAELTADIKAAYDLTNPKSEEMKNYREKRKAYAEAVAARDTEMISNLKETGRPFASTKTINAVNEAKADFTHKDDGNASTIEAAMEKTRRYEASDPDIFLKRRRDAWDRALVQDAYIVETYPRPESWADEKGWMKFKFLSTELIDEDKYSKTDTNTTAKYAKGIVDVTLNATYSKESTYKMTDDQSFTLEMSIKRVFVSWPWLDTEVFDHVNWKWNNLKQGVIVSDGLGTSTTQLPWLMNEFVIVKGVVIKTTAKKDLKTFTETNITAKADISVGPFTLNSEFKKHDKNTFIHNKNNEISIEIPDPQIIAVVSTRVPKCP